MSTINNDMSKNGLSITKIESSDTLIQFMEKCNNNFAKIVENGGGTKGDDGEKGDQGVPAKPKVPIHVWKEGDGKEFQYIKEYEIDGTYYIEYTEDLTDAKYQAGHLIMLENAHVYILEIDEVEQKLNPKFIIGLHSYDQNSIIDGKNAYVHIAYANNLDNFDDFITDNELRDEKNETEPVTTYSLKRNATTYSGASYINDRTYMGVCSNNLQSPPTHPEAYTWFRTKGDAGEQGPQGNPGVQGPQGVPGTAAVHLELTQDYIAVPSKPGGGGVHPDYNEDITLQMLLYEGDKQIDFNKISRYSIEIDGNPPKFQHDKEVKINQEIFSLITSDTTIICSATYNGNTYYKDLFIDLEDTPYELELNKNVLVRDVNNNNELIDDNLIVRVKYWMSGNWIDATDGNIYINGNAITYSNPTTIYLSNYISNDATEVRISYYKKGKELSYEVLGIINSGKDGEQGGSGYGILLSNPISVIPVGDDWKTDENIKTQSDSTFVYLYANSSDVSKNITISIPSPKNDNSDEDNNLKHFQIPEDDKNKVVFTPVVEGHAFNFGSNTQYKLPITINYQTDNFTTITNWTLTPVKGLDDIEVYVNKRVVNTTEETSHSISVGYYLTTPNSSKTLYTSKNNNPKGYDIILTNDIKNLSNVLKTTWLNVPYDFSSGNCYVVLVDSTGKIIDYTEVIAVKDGADGTPGSDGSDGITKFKSTVFTRSVGTPAKPEGGNFDNPNPTNDIWEDGIPAGSDPIWSSSRWFSNEAGFTDDWSVPILMCDTPDFEVIYSNSEDIINCNPNDATIFYKDTDGGISGWLNENIGVLNGKWSDDGDTNSIWMATIKKTNGIWGFPSGKWTISKIKGENGADGIPGTNGADGDTPELIKTDRIGFSTKELEYTSSDWVESIDKLGTLETTQTIYILYKQTWKYKISKEGFVTYYIATTLSGTQGIDGKSRVLFYLGSFEEGKATLSDESVTGLLNDERCDYYIDQSGQAWMRTGSDEVAVGYKDGKNSNNPSQWKESEKVGFLQSGAIHADMINAGSITANSGIVNTLFSLDITADKLKVNAANIDGVLEGHTIQSDTKISGSSDPTWQINNNGSGWLANKNIMWNENGVITIQGKDTSIGDAWKITDEGIESIAGNVKFRTDGSGHIGGNYTTKLGENVEIQKGISWDKNGDVTFYDKIISKPEFINLSNIGDTSATSYSVNTTDKATYIFIDNNCEQSNDEIIDNINYTECTCYRAYLSWFNFSKTIDLDDDTICDFTILNHSSKTVTFYISTDGDKSLRLPFRLIKDTPIPLHNYRLLNNHNVNYNKSNYLDGSEYGIQQLYLLPGSKLELCFENYKSNNATVQNFYINNISDFRMCYNNDNVEGQSPSLITTNYDLNNFNNCGGYSHPYKQKKSHRHLSLLRLMFSNILSYIGIEGKLAISSSSFSFIDDSQIFYLDKIIKNQEINFNEYYNNCIETLITPSDIYGYDYINDKGEKGAFPLMNLYITEAIKSSTNGSNYTKVQLIAYSPIYDTIYKSNEVDINIDPDGKTATALSFSQNDWNTFKWLGYNQQNSILDLFISFVFK